MMEDRIIQAATRAIVARGGTVPADDNESQGIGTKAIRLWKSGEGSQLACAVLVAAYPPAAA